MSTALKLSQIYQDLVFSAHKLKTSHSKQTTKITQNRSQNLALIQHL